MNLHHFTRRPAAIAAGLLLALGSATLQAAAPTSGVDRSGMDPAVRIQDDLFDAVNGGWIQKTEIPGDRAVVGTFIGLRDLSDERVKSLVEALAAQPQPAGSNARKIADFYTAYLDTAAIDKAGLAPVQPLLTRIAAVADLKGLLQVMASPDTFAATPLGLSVGPDPKRPDVYMAGFDQGGLGLSDRDYYLKDDERFAKARTAYVDYLRKLLEGTGDAQAAEHAQAVMALEKKIAQAQWSRVENRDPVKTYNPISPAELAKMAPGIDWAALAAAGELSASATVNISQPTYVASLAGLLRDEPLATWKLYMKVRALDAAAPLLPAAYRDARFAFRGGVLQGMTQERPRWQLAMGELNGALGEAVGERYVAKYFPPEAKARMLTLVGNLMAAYKSSIDGLTWMSPATKKAAHDKLSKYMTKIAYPDAWRDYSGLDVRAGDALGNAMRAASFAQRRELRRVGQKVDRAEWGMTPQTVNAYYNPTLNEIVFPAAILQPPFFDNNADDAVNYGAIGAVIGHEISHGFDDEGSQFDGDGKLRNWWTEDDRKAFDAITAKLVAQYDTYEPIPGKRVNGKLTLGENIADLSGLQIAFKAWKLSLGGKPAAVIDGYTGEQRFFLGWAQAWRTKQREARSLQLLVTDPHSPGRFRADGAAVNNDGFHEAFGTKQGDKMWKSPEDRIRLW